MKTLFAIFLILVFFSVIIGIWVKKQPLDHDGLTKKDREKLKNNKHEAPRSN